MPDSAPMLAGPSSRPVDPVASLTGQPERTRSPRSNEFWLAIAGIVATVLVGATASMLAYRTSNNQMQAETDRVAVEFLRDERMAAYVEFLTAVTDLAEAEFEFVHQMQSVEDFDIDSLVAKISQYKDQSGKYRQASARVELVGTPEVRAVHGEIVGQHNAIMNEIQVLAVDIARAGSPRNFSWRVAHAVDSVNRSQRDDAGLRSEFISAAQDDLGFAS